MTTETLARSVGEQTERRTLLKKAGAASLALVAGLLGRSDTAEATYPYHGCHLCHTPSSQGGPSCPSLRCSWCWWGECHGSPSHRNLCCEGYCYPCSGSCDSPGCTGVYCSFLGEYSQSC